MVVLLLCVSCAGSGQQPGALPSGMAGCYQLTLLPEEKAPEADRRRAAWRVPTIIRLDTTAFTGWPSLTAQYGEAIYQARGWWEGRWQEHPFIYWRSHPGDSIYVGHPGALAGVSLVLSIRGQPLSGVMTAFSDTPITDPTDRERSAVPVVARRVTCAGRE